MVFRWRDRSWPREREPLELVSLAFCDNSGSALAFTCVMVYFKRIIYLHTHYGFDVVTSSYRHLNQYHSNTLIFTFSSPALGVEDSSVGVFKPKSSPRIASARNVSCAGKTLERTR